MFNCYRPRTRICVPLKNWVQFERCFSQTAVVRRIEESDSHRNEGFNHGFKYQKNLIRLVSAVGVGASISIWLQSRIAESECSEKVDVTKGFGELKLGLPEYDAEEVAKHNTLETRVWVSFNHGVYDITDFIKKHPGGDAIMLGAGGSVEPFWSLYAVHKNPHVLKLLEKYRIGNLAAKDVGTETRNMEDPYANEPFRHVVLRPSSKQPFNAEPPPSLLVENLITPNEIFYVRNHLPVPEIDVQSYELEVEGLGVEERTLKLDDIKALPKVTITSAIQCGGNRRSEMSKVKSVKGLSWGMAAISNAEWSGARLCDVLKMVGLKPDSDAVHVQFEGYDLDPTGNPYGASIPIEKATDPRGDVILAYEMNGEPLPKDHGFPLRVIVPGVVGARNVKWLCRIILSKEESSSHWQQNDYKCFAPNVDWSTVDFSKSPAIQDMPITSAICYPSEGDSVKLKDGKLEVKGYAYSGGGRRITRVDVSADGGRTWREADELVTDTAKHPRAWGWTIWKALVPIHEGRKEIELTAKAIDSNHNTQPESFENIWNLRGLLSNAYHRVKVKIC